MTTERGGSVPFVGVFDIHVDLVSMLLEKSTSFIPWAHWKAGLITAQSFLLLLIIFCIFWRLDLDYDEKKQPTW